MNQNQDLKTGVWHWAQSHQRKQPEIETQVRDTRKLCSVRPNLASLLWKATKFPDLNPELLSFQVP